MQDLKFPLLDKINSTSDLKKLSVEQLPLLCDELRKFLIYSISNSSGHFASNLGTIELTVAIHYVYDSPVDKIIWDVGHQAYAHKVLTGRKDRIHQIRKFKGLHPFPFRAESEHDILTVGHSSTSLSVAAGICLANRNLHIPGDVIPVIGDGAFTAGMCFEALNHAGDQKLPMTIIYNDNNMSISTNKGIVNKYTSEFLNSSPYQKVRSLAKQYLSDGNPLKSLLKLTEDKVKHLSTPKIADIFEDFGVDYVTCVDGHDVKALVEVFKRIKGRNKLQVVHVLTTKGKGYIPAEEDPIKYHGVSNFQPEEHLVKSTIVEDSVEEQNSASTSAFNSTSEQTDLTLATETIQAEAERSESKESNFTTKAKLPQPVRLSVGDIERLDAELKPTDTYSKVFGSWLMAHKDDPRFIAVTPAMSEGSGMSQFEKVAPSKFVDVAIAEQHAVAITAGLSIGGLKPVCAIYSTFLQRGYDQLIHDLAIDNHDCVLGVDRAGIVGEDGQTHQGAFDISYLRIIPNVTIWTPSTSEQMLTHLEAGYQNPGVNVVRYPRDTIMTKQHLTDIFASAIEDKFPNMHYDDQQVLKFDFYDKLKLNQKLLYRPETAKVLFINFGTMLKRILVPAIKLDASVFDAQQVIDSVYAEVKAELDIAKASGSPYEFVVTFEENVTAGGAGSALAEYLINANDFTPVFKVGIPNRFIEPMEKRHIEEQMGWTQEQIIDFVQSKLNLKLGS